MSAYSFEMMKLWVPLKLHVSTDKQETSNPWDIYSIYYTPIDGEATSSAWKKGSDLAKEGWELVAAVPITASFFHAMEQKGGSKYPRDLSHTYTSGYELLLGEN